MTTTVYIGGSKGGTAKTTTAHLASLGAILCNEPATYVVTDPERKVRGEGRPYGVLDGRRPEALAHILSANHSGLNGWLFIDGGGNRQAFDIELAAEADLCLLPFRASEEDLDTVASDLQRLPNALAWPAAWNTNAFAQKAAEFYIDGLSKAFPQRVITPPIAYVNSVSELLAASLGSPSTPVRSLARKVFQVIKEHCTEQSEPNLAHQATSAVA
jgi:chromosome partitioning protein